MVQTGLFRSGAALVLLIILGALFLLWSLPLLGFSADPATGMVLAVEPGSPAAEQGMQVGDQILAIYGYPWSEAGQRLGLVPIPWQPEWSTPIVLLQAGEVRSIIVHPGAPVLALQVEKLLRTLLALVCWITGYLLGTSPRAVRSKLHWVGWFWIVLGGTLGLHHLLTSTSYLLTIALVWVQCTLLAPLAVAIHRWYPSRPIAHDVWQRAERILLWVLGVLQLLACGLWIASPSLLVFNTRLLLCERHGALAGLPHYDHRPPAAADPPDPGGLCARCRLVGTRFDGRTQLAKPGTRPAARLTHPDHRLDPALLPDWRRER
jgi:hypothetical protein